MPTSSIRRDALVAAFVTLAVFVGVSFGPLPDGTLISAESHDFAHVVVFGIVGLVLARTLRVLPPRTRPWAYVVMASLAVGGGFGLLTEIVQQRMGGFVSYGDVARDLLGTALGSGAAIALERATPPAGRALLWIVVISGLLAAAVPLGNALLDYRARATLFPVLLDPGAPRGLAFARGFGRTVTAVALPGEWQAVDGGAERALQVRIDSGQWPGLTLSEPAPDWRGWRLLVVDLVNPDDAPLTLQLRINDRDHDHSYDDRYNVSIELPPRSRRRVEFPVADIERAPRGRRMALDRIAKLIVFHDGAVPDRSFYVRAVALVR